MTAALQFVNVGYTPPAAVGAATFAIEALDLAVHPGEWLALLGPSGCGKTTLLRLALRLLRPDVGDVMLHGERTGAVDPVAWRRRLGYVPQEGGLFGHLSVRDNIGLVATVAGLAPAAVRARCDELLELVRLPAAEFGDRLPHELSGGQRQRVALARALQLQPQVLLCDEPFAALDPVTRVALRRELRALPALRERAVLLVTHDVQEAFELSDRVVLLDAGRVIQVGSPAELRSSPRTPWVAQFLGGGEP